MLRAAKAKTSKGKRILERRAPQLVEGEKQAAVLTGPKSSLLVNAVLADFYMLKKPKAVRFSRKNQIRPFEEAASLEFLTTKSETSLFVLGMHSKKRPNTVVLGRTFDHHVLDMFELQITSYKPSSDFTGPLPSYGNHPLVMFQGGDWETGRDLPVLRNLFLDYFRGDGHGGDLSLAGVERAIVLSAVDGTVYLRQYMLALKNAGVRTPHIELVEAGPRMSFAVRRSALGDDDARKAASKEPKAIKLPKNHERGAVGRQLGRLHLARQNLAELEGKTRLPKALRTKRSVDEVVGSASAGKRVKAGAAAAAAADDE